MRRTYGSKKATAGSLDHREMISMIDEKSSVFDAFYIQNIKQTKRELSCMGHSNHQGVASNKVRKRKYVKRIVKEVHSPLMEPLSESVCLTPDRSIRVNKVPDLFDQLLNSSPACAESKQVKKDDLFDKLRLQGPAKTYNRKKISPKNKFNYSSSDTESDKENSGDKNTNEIQNVTDICAHKLLIEKEHGLSPKIDESINKIVQNLSLLNNLNRQNTSSGSVQRNFRCNKNRLTKNDMNMATLQSSPLSSTPFTEKFRSKSIYKFSPIPMGDLDDSPNYVTTVEDNNESVVFVPKTSFSKLKESQSENRISPLSHLKSKYEINKTNVNKLMFNEVEISPECSKNSSVVEHKVESVISSLQISETQPFLGFANDFNEPKKAILLNFNKETNSHENTDISNETKVTEKNQSKDLFNDSPFELTEPSKPFYGFSNVITKDDDKESSFVFSVTKKSNSSNNKECSSHLKDNVEKDVSHDDPGVNCSFKKTLSTKPFLDFTTIKTASKTDSDSERDLTSKSDISEDTQERESLYDTCNSEQSSLNEDVIYKKKPVVKIEKMDFGLFQKYYEKMPNFESSSQEISVRQQSSDDYASLETNSSQDISENSTDLSKTKNYSTYSVSSQDISESSTDLSRRENDSTYNIDSNFDESSSNESVTQDNPTREQEFISFVTTRRRQETTNKSAIFILDDSYTSSNSGCDNTVLSNHKIGEKENYDNVGGTELQNVDEIQPEDNNVSEDSVLQEPRISFVTTRKNTKLFTERNVPKTQDTVDLDNPVIVLQPGKKWERSLSIYRRATTMTDNFDHSLLEDEDLHAKGRKYRQSVINTLELQDTIGSISNESFKSRRSTFISKPSRSTIRIVKEPTTRLTLSNTTVLEDLKGFLEDCDDTVVELSKLSITESDRDITVLEKIHDSRVTTAREYVLRRCNQTDTLLFDECYPDSLLKNCQKIGEGVYGEVYLYRGIDGRPRVMKIVPIAGSIKVNGEPQKDFDEVISEIVIAMELSALRAPIAEINRHFDEGKDIDSLNLQAIENATDVFNEVLAVKCVYGNYPYLLLDRWDLYDEIKGSENDNPAILPPDQQYIVLELANAGQDLESYQFNNAEQAYALFYQLAYGLAVAEEAFQFEHRDLHWGNVLIAPTDQKYATFVLRGRAHRVERCGVAASIIDYSLSRVSLPLGGGGGDSAALYNDLASDDGLFGAVGDYQFSVYRLMREKLGNDWKNYEPYTNILWLHYIVDKMITALRYKRTNTKTHKQYINKLKEVKERILNYGSATLFVLT